VTADDGSTLTAETVPTQSVRVDRGGFGVEVRFEEPMPVKLAQSGVLLVELVAPAPKPTPAERVGLKYTLVPFNTPRPAPAAPAPAAGR
jgi:hypothetical protein